MIHQQVKIGDERVPYLFVRGNKLTWRQTIAGKGYLRSIPLPPVDPSKEIPRQMVADAKAWIKKAQRIAMQGRHEVLEETKVRRDIKTVGEVCDVFRELARRWGSPSERTIRQYCNSLALVAEIITGAQSGEGVLVSELTGAGLGKVVDHYLEANPNAEQARISAFSIVNQARGVFSVRFIGSPEYDALKLPTSILGFLKGHVCDHTVKGFQPFSQAEVDLLKAGIALKEAEPAAYAHWFLGYYCALRLSEAAQAKASWIRERVITDQERAPWMGKRKTIYVLDLASDPDAQLKTAASAGYVPLADDVAAELRRIAGGREYIVPGPSPTARVDAGRRTLNNWMRTRGWNREKAHHSFRAYRMQVWFGKYGEECRAAWGRHSTRGVGKYYVSRLYLARAPLGLAE